MKRPKLKRASKRMSCAKRFKIQKKVREHNRKLRKEAKKSGVRRRTKKDVGVPNSAPFKEEVLREAAQRKQEREELKATNRLAKQKERAEKKRKKGNEERSEPSPAKKKKLKKREKVKVQREKRAAVAKQKSSKRFRCSELNKVIEASDVILEVLDARDPWGCRCPQLEEAVLKREKRLMFVLNKIDLVPKDNLQKWAQFLPAQCPTFVFKSSIHIQDKAVRRAKNDSADLSRAAASFGCDSLARTLELLAENGGADEMLKVGVVGFPNVGKSSVINTLKGSRVCNAGVLRGLTKCLQEVHISEKVKLIDSPAIVAAPSNSSDELALRGLQEDESEENPLEAVRELLRKCDQQQIMLHYNVPKYKTSLEFLTYYSKHRCLLQKGSLPDTKLAASLFLKDWIGAKPSYYSKVPERESLPPHLTRAMVAGMQNGVDLDRIATNNKGIIKCVRAPRLSANILYTPKGLTAGIVDVRDLPEGVVVEEEEDDEHEEDISDIEDAMENVEETETSVSEVTQSQKSRKQKKGAGAAAVNIDLLAAQRVDDDSYDFSTDFV